jgi:prevent-host-death family protein
MEQAVSMAEAKSKLAELVGQVRYGGNRYILERRGQPVAILISLEEYQRLQAREDAGAVDPFISPALRQRQEALIAQARSLRARFGPPERRLAALFADLPPDDDPFWLEILETD